LNDQVKTWAVIASHYIGECFDHCQHLLDQDNSTLDSSVRFISTQLYLDCHFSSESSLILIQEGKEWDADIINRSIIEGTVKYLYMIACDDVSKKERAHEYWYILPKFSAIKRHQRAKDLLDAINGYDDSNWQAIKEQLLSEEKIAEFRSGLNRNERKAIEQKWSFSEIVNEFAKSKQDGLEMLVHLAYNYGMSSHLIHKDGDGVGMVWDRCMREPKRQMAVKLGHSSRIISDICVLSRLRSMYLMKACSEDYKVLSELETKYKHLFSELAMAIENFNKVEYGT